MDQLPPPSTAPAGWYPDPVTGRHRYFDGVRWADAGFEVERVDAHPHLPLAAALGALAVLVVSLVTGKAVVDALVGRDWPLITYIAISAVISYGPSLVWLAYVRRRWGAGRLDSLGWRFRWIDLAWGPVTWLSAVGVQLVLAAVVLIFDVPLSNNVESISEADADRAYLIATAVAAVIAAPIVEELVFRGLVLRGFLSRLGPVMAVAIVPNNQIFNAYLVWGDRDFALTLGDTVLPTGWLITLDAIVSVSFLAGVALFYRWWKTKWTEPDELTKIIIGSLFSIGGMACLYLAAATTPEGEKIGLFWPVMFHVVNSIGFAHMLPVSLALFARLAPKQINATVIGLYYLAFFAGNSMVGWIGGWFEEMPVTSFWLMHMGFAAAAGAIFVLFKLLLAPRLMHRAEPEDVALA